MPPKSVKIDDFRRFSHFFLREIASARRLSRSPPPQKTHRLCSSSRAPRALDSLDHERARGRRPSADYFVKSQRVDRFLRGALTVLGPFRAVRSPRSSESDRLVHPWCVCVHRTLLQVCVRVCDARTAVCVCALRVCACACRLALAPAAPLADPPVNARRLDLRRRTKAHTHTHRHTHMYKIQHRRPSRL
jgi:hypothetical protein